jgi:hypothetical protein
VPKVTAIGGAGGSAYGTGTGGAGGSAKAAATATTPTGSAPGNYILVRAYATGGAGGGNYVNGNGGAGGAATGASATATYGYNAYAQQTGGPGGSGSGAGHAGGAGGVASKTTATANSSNYKSATASVHQTSGAGGYGASGANGGQGATSTLTEAVSGSTAGGAGSILTLNQFATGGAGGGSSASTGGAGGGAVSNLSFNDVATNTTHANSITGTVGAYGGAGGSSPSLGGAGGGATASLTLTGAFSISATSEAIGGMGGVAARGGKATAMSDAIGTTLVSSNATAIGGDGGASAGRALATAIGQGGSGSVHAQSTGGSITGGSLVTAASAIADAPVAGSSTAKTWAVIGNGAVLAPALIAEQAVAQITAEPKGADVNTIEVNNPHIKAAFTTGKTPAYFGIGELGGAYSTSGSGSETETSSVHMTVDLTKMASLHDLIIGFYSGTATGGGFTSMSLDVKINGTDHITNIASAGSASAFFQNNAVDYGPLSGTSLQLDVSLSVTESAAGGYDFGMLIGDPPPGDHSLAHHNLVAAMATFGTGISGTMGTNAQVLPNDHHTLFAARSA